MNKALKNLRLTIESSTKLILSLEGEKRIIEVEERNQQAVKLIAELVNACRDFYPEIVPCTEEQFERAISKLCGEKYCCFQYDEFGLEELHCVILDIQFSGKMSILFFLPLLLSRLNVTTHYVIL